VKRRPRSEIVVLAVHVGGLGVALLAIALGLAPARMWAAARFLLVGAAASIFVEAAARMTRRRARRQSAAAVPEGVRLRKPIWMSIADPAQMAAYGAIFGAVAAVAGFAATGTGILLTFAAMAVGPEIVSARFSAQSLTFEPGGLRVHLRGASFLLPWKSITAVEQEGPEHHRAICLRLLEIGGAVGSAQPATPQARARVRSVLDDGEPPTGTLTLWPWTAGLDGPVLARAISAAAQRQGDRPN
jgi:hypothetical protein